MRSRAYRAFLSAVALTLVAVACSSSSTPTVSSSIGSGGAATPSTQQSTQGGVSLSNITACALITPDDVKAVLGKAVGAGDATEGPASHITLCNYSDAALLVRVSPE